MSGPINERLAPGALEYAPRWARGEAGERAMATNSEAAPPAAVPYPYDDEEDDDYQPINPDPPWKGRRRADIFEGDVAIVELRNSLALAPDVVPAPPVRPERMPLSPIIARLGVVGALAVVGTYGIVWLTAHTSASPVRPAAPAANMQAPVSDAGGTTFAVKGDRAPLAHAPWPVAADSRDLTTGTSAVRSASREAPAYTVAAMPAVSAPPAATPATVAAAPVASPPVAASAPARASTTSAVPDRAEIAALLGRSRAYLAEGDVAAARLILRRAVEGGDSEAMLALGSTYDPLVLQRLGVISFAGDPAQAREWYRRAAELGSTDAPVRIDQLAQVDRQ
jgi:hypothetical protein